MLASIPRSVSSMLLKDTRFYSDRIAMISNLSTHLNPSSSENLLLAFSDLTRIGMILGELIIYFMLHVSGISQQLKGVTIDKIIPLLSIASLDHYR